MSLPFILEIAIGLTFIYLVLSLLASEIQEIIGTLLQWRAEHLKRSIEVLLAGNDEESFESAQAFAHRLYDSPLIRGLNQEARGPIGHFFRLINQAVGTMYRAITRTRNVFGQSTSGPSHIPPEVFAQTLLDNLQVSSLRKLLVETRLKQFVEERLLLPINHIVNDLRASTANEFLLNPEFRQLEQSIGQVVQDFQDGRTTLPEALNRLLDCLGDFATMAQEVLPDNHHLTEAFMRRLQYLKAGLVGGDLDKLALLKKLQPSLHELLSVLDDNSPLHRELLSMANKEGGAARAIAEKLRAQGLPPSLRQSLTALADRVEGQVDSLEADVRHLTQEVETWFDRGMERASGVYRRNAKAVALIVGVAIAVALNADSLHMLDRLTTDPAIRSAITQAAEQLAVENPEGSNADLTAIQTSLSTALERLPIPVGYRDAITDQQAQAETTWPLPIPRRVLGWLITGFAISMGANFWFNLLRKVVQVKTSGGTAK